MRQNTHRRTKKTWTRTTTTTTMMMVIKVYARTEFKENHQTEVKNQPQSAFTNSSEIVFSVWFCLNLDSNTVAMNAEFIPPALTLSLTRLDSFIMLPSSKQGEKINYSCA